MDAKTGTPVPAMRAEPFIEPTSGAMNEHDKRFSRSAVINGTPLLSVPAWIS